MHGNNSHKTTCNYNIDDNVMLLLTFRNKKIIINCVVAIH